MTLVKLQHIMSNEISKRSFISRPPEPPAGILMGDPLSSIFIGTTKIFKVPFTWSYSNITNPHIAVVGITGAGKSYFVKTFLVRANYIWGTNAIIIDFAGEYKAWVKQSGGVVVSLGKGDYLNIMDLSSMKPLDRTKQIMTSLEILTDISMYPEQKRITEEAIEQAYINFGFSLSEAAPKKKEVPTLHNVISLLQEKLQEGTYEYPAELENAVYRLRQFAREGEDYFSKKSTLDLGKLSHSGLVAVDLSGLSDDRFRAFAALFILQTLKEIMRSENWSESKGLKALVVLDEAWKVASDDKSDAILIVREGRKFQFGLIVASQNPTDINEAIFSNVGTTFILKIKFEKFMNYIQGSLNFSDFIRLEIGKFGVGQAAVDMAFQSAIRFPSVFILDKIYGEEPLYVYTLDLSDVLTQSEMSANVLQKDYQFERDELRNRLIEYNVGLEIINQIFSTMDMHDRTMKLLDFLRILKKSGGISISNTVIFLKSLGIDDQLITRIIASTGVSVE
ncbi:MAG: ATP-binding protein [Candidatus Micrarchaeota archaeon]|nr:ATP-binding protein [Candidatus Micrarchaeota archaeon]